MAQITERQLEYVRNRGSRQDGEDILRVLGEDGVLTVIPDSEEGPGPVPNDENPHGPIFFLPDVDSP